MEVSPGVYTPPEDDSYSVDFTVDILNQAYPCCTGVHLSGGGGGHLLAFYGKRGTPNVTELGTSCKQEMPKYYK